MVMLCVIFGRRIATLKEFLNASFTFNIHWTLWIHGRHQRNFVVCHYGQMTDEVHELPAVLVPVVALGCSECRHPREADAVFNNVVKLPIAESLCCLQGHIGS